MKRYLIYVRDLKASYHNTWIGDFIEASSEASAILIAMRRYNVKSRLDVRSETPAGIDEETFQRNLEID